MTWTDRTAAGRHMGINNMQEPSGGSIGRNRGPIRHCEGCGIRWSPCQMQSCERRWPMVWWSYSAPDSMETVSFNQPPWGLGENKALNHAWWWHDRAMRSHTQKVKLQSPRDPVIPGHAVSVHKEPWNMSVIAPFLWLALGRNNSDVHLTKSKKAQCG